MSKLWSIFRFLLPWQKIQPLQAHLPGENPPLDPLSAAQLTPWDYECHLG